MSPTDHVTLNINNSTSTAAVFLDIEKGFDTTWLDIYSFDHSNQVY
jgi:hypothetical protein